MGNNIIFKTLRENVAEIIRNKILNHNLEPGMRILEQDLAQELRISRGPIREALRQLEQEGLVEYSSNRSSDICFFQVSYLYLPSITSYLQFSSFFENLLVSQHLLELTSFLILISLREYVLLYNIFFEHSRFLIHRGFYRNFLVQKNHCGFLCNGFPVFYLYFSRHYRFLKQFHRCVFWDLNFKSHCHQNTFNSSFTIWNRRCTPR